MGHREVIPAVMLDHKAVDHKSSPCDDVPFLLRRQIWRPLLVDDATPLLQVLFGSALPDSGTPVRLTLGATHCRDAVSVRRAEGRVVIRGTIRR